MAAGSRLKRMFLSAILGLVATAGLFFAAFRDSAPESLRLLFFWPIRVIELLFFPRSGYRDGISDGEIVGFLCGLFICLAMYSVLAYMLVSALAKKGTEIITTGDHP